MKKKEKMSMKKLLDDPELDELRNKCKVLGRWIPYHWETMGSIEEYKEHMRNYIKKHEANN